MGLATWSASATAVAERVLDRVDVLVSRMGDAYQSEVPEYAALGDVAVTTSVLPTSRAIVVEFFTAVTEGRVDDIASVETLAGMGRRRLEMGVPLEPMLHVFRVASRVVWNEVVGTAGVDEFDALGPLGAGWMDYMDRASSIAAAGYLEASHDHLRQVDARRGALLDAVLDAADEVDLLAVATDHNVVLASRYLPVVGRGGVVAAAIDRALETAPAGTIGGLRGGVLLLLCPNEPDDLDALRVAASAEAVVVGSPGSPGPELRDAVRDALLTLRVTSALAREGAFWVDDFVVERLILADIRLSERLRTQIWDPILAADRSGVLVETLTEFLDRGSIPATAGAVSVHANTVTYRLRRVQEITGLDPRRPVDAARLLAALVAGSLVDAS